MTLELRLAALRQAFPDLDEWLVSYIAQNAREQHIAAGDRIFAEDDAGDAFYIIVSGRVQVSKFLELGTQRLLNELGPGQFFGEMALIEEAPRMVSVDALADTTLVVVTKLDFQNLIMHNPTVGLAVMRSVVHRFRDSDRHAIEELRDKNRELAKAYAELAESTRRKSEFLTVVSHELRTPLTSIKGYTHLARSSLLTDDRLQQALTAIANNTDALVRLINSILFLQELELIEPTFEPIELSRLINPILDTVRPQASNSGLTLCLELPADLPKVRGDHDGLTQAIGALVDNAVKFSPHGGEIKVSAELDNGRLALVVADPGIGIAADELYHIFDPYRHLDVQGDHRFGGLGLGLPIAKQVVEQHGGTLSVVSRPGEGSTFTVRLPIIHEEEMRRV
jgi:signal transduction histidine kinase